jgi:hypothetical protein
MKTEGTLVYCLNCDSHYIDVNVTFHNPDVTGINISNCFLCDPEGKKDRIIFYKFPITRTRQASAAKLKKSKLRVEFEVIN